MRRRRQQAARTASHSSAVRPRARLWWAGAPAAPILGFVDQRKKLVAAGIVGKLAGPMGDVRGRLDRQISTQGQFHDQGAFLHLATSRDVRDVLREKIPAVNDTKRVAVTAALVGANRACPAADCSKTAGPQKAPGKVALRVVLRVKRDGGYRFPVRASLVRKLVECQSGAREHRRETPTSLLETVGRRLRSAAAGDIHRRGETFAVTEEVVALLRHLALPSLGGGLHVFADGVATHPRDRARVAL